MICCSFPIFRYFSLDRLLKCMACWCNFLYSLVYVDNQAIYLNHSTIIIRHKFVTPGFTVEKYVVLKSLIEYYERVTNSYEF